ncbi:unnamed protein product [Gordionus sp. m RMFG-2023]|uniref:hsc70-interacting protein-like n=1 Tax=Gordionus sp. m RMFG-2023 TaxID=3053472 RepID=UPI0030E0E652
MSFPKEQINLLKDFVKLCTLKPEVLQSPELNFFRDWIASLGSGIKHEQSELPKTHIFTDAAHDYKSDKESSNPSDIESEDIESDIEFDNELTVKPDANDNADQDMGNNDIDVTEDMETESDNKRQEANKAMGEGDLEGALKLYAEAIQKNPNSAALFAKRAQIFNKLNRPRSAIKDCDKALQLNPDSSLGLRVRGKANCMLGHWTQAKLDLAQSLKIDFDPDTNDLLKKVMPNAHKIEEYERKKDRKKTDKLEKQMKDKQRKVREAHDKAKKDNPTHPGSSIPGFPGALGGATSNPGAAGADMGDFFKTLMADPEILEAFQDAEISAAFQDISANPANMAKYQSNPKISAFLQKMVSKIGSGSGVGSGFPKF